MQIALSLELRVISRTVFLEKIINKRTNSDMLLNI